MSLTLQQFAEINRSRCESPQGFNHPVSSWSLSDWMTAVAGEMGEAANIIKKLNRERDGIPGNTIGIGMLREDLANELADTFCYLDLLAQAAGVDLEAAVRDKFNAVSAKIGAPHQI